MPWLDPVEHKCLLPRPTEENANRRWQCDDADCKKIWKLSANLVFGLKWIEQK